MNILLKKEDIYPILSQIQGLLEKRSTLPIFMNILLESKGKEKVYIYASDSEQSFTAYFPAKVKKEGAIVIRGKKLFEIIRELSPETFELSAQSNYQIKLSQNQSVFKIHGLNPEDFPKMPVLETNKSQKVPVEDFLEVIEKTLYCVSLDESRYHLTGVFLEQLSSKYRFVATDGHRMSFIEIKGEKVKDLESGIIIPKKGLVEAKKMFSQAENGELLELLIEKPRILIRFKNQSLNIRLIEGQYPDYKKLLPKYKGSTAILSTEDFLSSLKRISVLTSARFKGVNFTFKKNILSMHFSHPDEGEAFEELPCKYEGEELKIRFNSKYILDILQSLYEKQIKFLLKDNKSPGIIQAEGRDSYTCLVMPMKL